MDKLKNNARILEKVFRILKVALDIALIASLVGLAILAVGLIFNLDANQIGHFSGTFDLGFIGLRIADAYAPNEKSLLLHAGAEVLAALAYILAARIAVRYVREILQPMTEGAPFGGVVSERLYRLSKLTLLLGLIANGIRIIGQVILAGGYDLNNLLLSEKIAQVTLNYELDLTFLLVFAALRLLAYVFRYGEELQKLSDETL